MAEQQVYRVVTRRLRVQRGPGRHDLVVERPMNKAMTRYLDSDAAPTLITFDEHCQVDMDGLLRLGAIVPYTPPKPKPEPKPAKGDARGETAG